MGHIKEKIWGVFFRSLFSKTICSTHFSLIFHCFYGQNVILEVKMLIFRWFCSILERCAVRYCAERCSGGSRLRWITVDGKIGDLRSILLSVRSILLRVRSISCRAAEVMKKHTCKESRSDLNEKTQLMLTLGSF